MRGIGRKGSAARAVEVATDGPETYLDRGSELVGELRFAEAVRIDGKVAGAIEAEKTVVVGPDAVVEAGIRAEVVEVYGTVQGDIRVRRKVILHERARVAGEIETAGIVVEEGARFKGCILIGVEDGADVLDLGAGPEAAADAETTPSPEVVSLR